MPTISLAGLVAEVRNAHEVLLRTAQAFRRERSRETRLAVEHALSVYKDLALELFDVDRPWTEKTKLAAPLGELRRKAYGND